MHTETLSIKCQQYGDALKLNVNPPITILSKTNKQANKSKQ